MTAKAFHTIPHVPAYTRAIISVMVGTCIGVTVGIMGFWNIAPLALWDTAVVVYVLWVMMDIFTLTSDKTATLASSEDPGIPTADAILLIAGVASLVAVGFLLFQAGNAEGIIKGVYTGLGVGSVILSWILVHVIFTLRYARLYYAPPQGGIDFNMQELPRYTDFAYMAFTIGMTFQVSDTSLQNKDLRIAVLHHALLSYLFGTVIVATTINLVVGLSTG